MATMNQYHPRTYHDTESKENTTTKRHARLWAVPVGRFFFSLLFILSGFNHFTGPMIAYAESAGVPMASLLVPLSGLMSILGGLSILLGYKTRIGALLIVLFLIPVSIMMHAFWNIADPQESQSQMIHFMKNMSMLGGAILLMFYGAGPISLDHKKQKSS